MTRRAREGFVVCLDHERTSKPSFSSFTIHCGARYAMAEFLRESSCRANRQGAWILEDDYDGEFRYTGRPLAAVQGIDPHQRVIYIGTFTMVLFPALRLAYAVVPEDLVDAFVVARGVSDGHPRAPSQIALADFFAEGHFGAHIRRMREVYRERRDALVAATGRHLAGLDLRSTDAGLHAVANLKGRANDRATSGRIARAGVDAQPLSRFHLGPPASPGLFTPRCRRLKSATR
jgi:GntR family transcriptional regulator/MocR family aminotransferase